MLTRLYCRAAALWACREGVTSMEYGIIAAVTVVVVGTAMGGVNGPLTTIWNNITLALVAAS
jgi:Flp pilus assembly pilin Flp